MSYGNLLDVDIEKSWLADEDVVILVTCPECGALYELGAIDLRDVQDQGQVTCACGASIDTAQFLFGIDTV